MLFIQDTEVLDRACDCCGAVRTVVSAFVGDEQQTIAAVLVYCYPPHLDDPSVIWVDAILGTWGERSG